MKKKSKTRVWANLLGKVSSFVKKICHLFCVVGNEEAILNI